MTILYTIFLLFFSANTTLHEIHISKAELNYKSEKKMMQISMHIFLDDLEAELETLGGKQLYLCTERESPEGETFMLQYIAQNFKVIQKGKPLQLEFVGKEVSDDLIAVWCYFEIPMENIDELSIQNQIMLSRYADQKNIVSVKNDGKRKAFFILDKADYLEELK